MIKQFQQLLLVVVVEILQPYLEMLWPCLQVASE